MPTIILGLLLILSSFKPIWAQISETDLQKQINDYETKIAVLNKTKDTLKRELSILSYQTELTLLKIQQTQASIKLLESEISALSAKIDSLDTYLNQLSSIYISQIVENYKLQKRIPQYTLLLQAKFNQLLQYYKYTSLVQKENQNTLVDLETARTNFDLQKAQKKKKQDELGVLQKSLTDQKASLSRQTQSKANLLEITQNDELRYQKLKAEAQAELESLQTAIFDGSKQVKKGDPIGIMGNTGFSLGAHLHFGLYNLTESQKGQFDYYNDLDSSSYLNQHQWPMKNYVITQGRGHTKYSNMYADKFHHGIDMYSNEKTIYATEDGIAYFYKDQYPDQLKGGGNHIKLFHSDGKMTLYFHLSKFYK